MYKHGIIYLKDRHGGAYIVFTFFGILITSVLIYNVCYKESNKKYEEYFEEMYNDWEDYYD